MKQRIALALVFVLLAAAIAWAVSATDDFNRADGGLGANWTTMTNFDPPEIVSQMVRANISNGNGGAYYNGISPANDQWTQLTLTTWTESSLTIRATPFVRGSTVAETYYGCIAQSENFSDSVAIVEMVAGNPNFLSSDLVGVTATDVLRCEVTGADIDMKKNAVSILTANDATITSGRVGFLLFTDGSEANLRGDDWSGGDNVAVAATGRKVIIVE